MARPASTASIVCALLLAAGDAAAHDTWFAPLPPARDGALALALGTGNRFPKQETPVGVEQLTARGCRAHHGVPASLLRAQDTPTALWLRSAASARQAQTCWAEVQPFDVELTPDKVAIYLDEINAPAPLREAWAGQRQRGVPWRERYSKHARIEHAPAGMTVPAAPAPMAMDVLMRADGGAPIAVDQALGFQVLRDGAPLAGLAVEFRSERSTLGIWRRTDAQGRVEFAPPLPGRWVLRGTDLRLAAGDSDRWESRFVTLAFEVPGTVNERRAAAVTLAGARRAPHR